MLKEYFSITEILELELKGYSKRSAESFCVDWVYREIQADTKPLREYHISNFPSLVREEIVKKLLQKQRLETQTSNLAEVEKIEKEAYARFEIVHYAKSNKINKQELAIEYNKKRLPLSTYDTVPSLSVIQLYRWLDSYAKHGIDGLKSREASRKAGKIKSSQAKELVEGALLNKPHLKTSIIYDFLCGKAKRDGFVLPSYKTITRYADNFRAKNKVQLTLASNPDAYKSKYMLALGSYSEEAIEPNYIWEVDSTPADIMLTEGRCTILGCIDVYTRRVKFLVQKSSNSLGITSLIRNCILDWGLPKIIKSDNGADYKSKQVEIALKMLGIEQRFTNPYSGWEKPFVERVFGTTQHGHLEAHKNFIGHNVAERRAIESVKSFAERILKKEKEFAEFGIEDLQRFLDVWANNYYCNKPHGGLKKYVKKNKLNILPTPSSMLQYAVGNGFKAKDPISTRDLDLLLEPLAGKRTIGKKGILVDGNNYFNPELSLHVGDSVVIRVDRADLGKIYVFDNNHNYICEAINYELLGSNKLEFIKKSKSVQNELTKQFKRETKSLVKKAKELPSYGFIQVDLEEAIEEAEKKDKLNDKNNQKVEIAKQEEIAPLSDGRYSTADKRLFLAAKIKDCLKNGKEWVIEKEDLEWYEDYKKDGEYLAKIQIKEAENGKDIELKQKEELETIEINKDMWR
jgi:transposase InsO family protein